jgi:DNA-binding transcriptional LysR family regulator
MIRRLATLDLGIALHAEAIVTDDLAAGRLRRVLPKWQAFPISVYAITETRLLPAKTQRFIELLNSSASAWVGHDATRLGRQAAPSPSHLILSPYF